MTNDDKDFKPCPCGKQPTKLHIVGSDAKWKWVSGDCCNEWNVEFRTGYYKDESPELMERAIYAWNYAPRPTPQQPSEKKALSPAPESSGKMLALLPEMYDLTEPCSNKELNRREGWNQAIITCEEKSFDADVILMEASHVLKALLFGREDHPNAEYARDIIDKIDGVRTFRALEQPSEKKALSVKDIESIIETTAFNQGESFIDKKPYAQAIHSALPAQREVR